jgi:hypothetical protein
MTKGLKGFNTQNKDRVGDDMARRNHMRNKDKIAEGYYATGKKSSYSDAVPSVKIVIEHSRVIEEGEQRYRNINRIFLENQAGERYLLDTKKPGIARVYARHIAEGGKVNDDRWSHIGSLCEEYQKMAGFVRATRNGQFNESAQSLVNEGIAHYASLRESLSRMTGKRGYNAYFESWTPSLMEDGTEENNLNELFVQETLDPRIESVMPILNRIHKKVSESVVDKEMNKLAEWADSLVEEGGESLTSNNPIGIPEEQGVAEGSLNEGQYEMMMRNGQVKKFIAKDDADAKRIAAGHGAKSVIKLRGGVPAGKVAEQGVAEMAGIEETHPAVRQLKNKLGQVAKQNPGSGLGRHYDNIKNGMTYKSLVNKGMVDQNGQINIPGFKDDDKEKEVDEQAPGWARHLGGAALGAATGAGGAFAGAPLGPLGMAAGGALAGANGYELGMKGVDAVWDKFSGKKPDAPLLHQTKDAFGREQTAAGNDVAEGTGSSIERILAAHPEAVENFKQGGDLDYDLESDLWEYYYNNGEIRNYDADASEFISQSLADELGLSEGLDANQKRVGQLGPTEKVKNNNIGKLVGANENFINTVDQAVVSEEDEMAESILSAIKKVGKKVIDTVAPGDEKLLKQLDKDVHGNKVPNRYNSDAESAKKYPADSWKAKVDESSDELARILTIMNHRR